MLKCFQDTLALDQVAQAFQQMVDIQRQVLNAYQEEVLEKAMCVQVIETIEMIQVSLSG